MVKLTQSINAKIEATPTTSEWRGYLGLSQVGHACDRYLYYVLHNAHDSTVYPRTLRIWERGDWEEGRIIKDLESIGITVTDEQKEIYLYNGRIRGHIDGIATIDRVPHLLEIKTMAETYWKQCVKNGVFNSHNSYWVQAQLYANFLSLEKILFVTTNKNNEERYFEFLDADSIVKYTSELRIKSILTASEPPKRIGGPSWHVCKWCSMKSICHEGEEPKKTCHSCTRFCLKDAWICKLDYGEHIPDGCSSWESCVG